ncbi:MAG: hypothetical protein GC190_20160 [Alphaproteobacteria bacterium]|nr:hypothetical protein [Alphaproteobacteria bacterium]
MTNSNRAVARAPNARLTNAERATFLSALASTGSIAAAARTIGRARSTMHSAIGADPAFKLEVESATDAYVSKLLQQAHRLAIDGVSTPIFDRDGEQVGERVKYSERVLLKLLERRDADFAPKTTVEHTGRVEHQHSLDVSGLALSPQARVELLAALLLQRADTLSDSERQSELIAIAERASRYAVPFDVMAQARLLRIGALANDAVDADYEEVDPEIEQFLKDIL